MVRLGEDFVVFVGTECGRNSFWILARSTEDSPKGFLALAGTELDGMLQKRRSFFSFALFVLFGLGGEGPPLLEEERSLLHARSLIGGTLLSFVSPLPFCCHAVVFFILPEEMDGQMDGLGALGVT